MIIEAKAAMAMKPMTPVLNRPAYPHWMVSPSAISAKQAASTSMRTP